MAEPHIHFEAAVLYVLDRLGPAERREFENHMKQSPELRTLVRELETGATALALATPQQEPPPEVWQRIEAAVAAETEVVPTPFWPRWLRSGWAAAAACLLGWLLYGFWVHRSHQSLASPTLVAEQTGQGDETEEAVAPSAPAGAPRQPVMVTNVALPSPQLSLQAKGQIAALRREVLDLEKKVEQLSQIVTQQHALLAEPTRLKFFNLPPGGIDGTGTNTPPPSAAAQRALLLAVARQLGWQPASSETIDQELGIDFVPSPATNQPTVARSSTRQNPAARTEQSATAEQDAAAVPSTQVSAIPGYASLSVNGGYDVTLAVDSSMLPAGVSTLDVWVSPETGGDSLQYYGLWDVTPSGSVLTLQNANSVVLGFTDGSPTNLTWQSASGAPYWRMTNAP